MPFPPKSDDYPADTSAPVFAKKPAKKRFGKKGQRKAAPIQKSMMQSGRSPAGRR